jgi:hypothetical protein
MFQTLAEHAFPTTIARYTELLESPLQHARRLSEFAGLDRAGGRFHSKPQFRFAGQHDSRPGG